MMKKSNKKFSDRNREKKGKEGAIRGRPGNGQKGMGKIAKDKEETNREKESENKSGY